MKGKIGLAVAVTAAVAIGGRLADGCEYHWAMGLPEPTGIWPVTPAGAAAQLKALDSADDAAVSDAVLDSATATGSGSVTPAIDTYVTSWLLNTTGVKGRSTNATINAAVSSILANVQQIAYTATNVYIRATGIPDYNIGPFNGNPNVPANDNATFDIPRNPQPATIHAATGLGAIGVLVNGVDVFNMSDANSYQNKGVWHNNAGVVEAPGFDLANAHPQQQGVYHNHENPVSLISELGGSVTAPVVIGYAVDGYPILNDYASLTPGGPVVKMMSGYQLKSYAGGVRGNGGPNVAAPYVLGYFEEDYQWVSVTEPAGEAELDPYNGAFVYTPQFPNGTYAYFATTDLSGAAAYPYLLGPTYYGTPSSDDVAGGTVVVPADAVAYTAPEAGTLAMIVFGAAIAMRRRK